MCVRYFDKVPNAKIKGEGGSVITPRLECLISPNAGDSIQEALLKCPRKINHTALRLIETEQGFDSNTQR